MLYLPALPRFSTRALRQPIDDIVKKMDPILPSSHSRWMRETSLMSYFILTARRLSCYQNTLISITGCTVHWAEKNPTGLGRSTSVQCPYMDPCWTSRIQSMYGQLKKYLMLASMGEKGFPALSSNTTLNEWPVCWPERCHMSPVKVSSHLLGTIVSTTTVPAIMWISYCTYCEQSTGLL